MEIAGPYCAKANVVGIADSGQTDNVVCDGVSDRRLSASPFAALLTEPKCADDGMVVEEDPLRTLRNSRSRRGSNLKGTEICATLRGSGS